MHIKKQETHPHARSLSHFDAHVLQQEYDVTTRGLQQSMGVLLEFGARYLQDVVEGAHNRLLAPLGRGESAVRVDLRYGFLRNGIKD